MYLNVTHFLQADLHFYNFNYNVGCFYVWVCQYVLSYDFWKIRDRFVKLENADAVTSTCKIMSLETKAIFEKMVTRGLRLLKGNLRVAYERTDM